MLLDFSHSFKHTFSGVPTGSTKKEKRLPPSPTELSLTNFHHDGAFTLEWLKRVQHQKSWYPCQEGRKNKMMITQMIYIIYAYVGIKYMHIWYLWLLICEINLASKRFFPTDHTSSTKHQIITFLVISVAPPIQPTQPNQPNPTQLHSNQTQRQSTPLQSIFAS